MKLNWKIWILIFAILGSLLALIPLDFSKGVEITSLSQNSTAYEQGIRQGQTITAINGNLINNLEDYYNTINSIFPVQEKTKIIITTESNEFILFTNETLNINVKDRDKTRIKTGLDLSGGARALVSAEKELTTTELNDLIAVTNQRLNVYGLKDIIIRPVSDLSGNNYMLIEIAGSSPKELEDLIAKQGKFEAKIGNDTVFTGGNKDITYVARTGQESGIYSCSPIQSGESCSFRFTISLSEDAAKKHANITNQLGINETNPQYLDKKLDLYLDEQLIDSLFISIDLKGSETTQISISGSGFGTNRKEAFDDATAKMKKLQTVLITGSLPFKLEIQKLDTISPLLGKEFINTILIAGAAAILAVGLIVFFRYRKIKLSIAVLLTSLAEVLIILGISALFKRNLDLPAIAGIIAAIGTGVDSQIIILDESQMSENISLIQRIKNALFIILGTYITTFFALLPLVWAGAGLLKGFAITTIIGISAGVLITRPAFSEIVKRILKD
jgi:preprotein translocase subunit SecD